MKPLSAKIILIKNQHRKIYLYVAALILLITGMSKLVMLSGAADMLGQFDPITGMSFKALLTVAGVAEVLVAAYVLFVKSEKVSFILIAFMSSVFVFYRLIFKMTGWTKPCHCLGNLTDILQISPLAADLISVFMLLLLFIGSYTFLLWDFYRFKAQSYIAKLEVED